MPSPFPGMNPYLENNEVWEDFHRRYLVFLAGRLEAGVGAGYLVKIETRLYLRELPQEERTFFGKADVGVSATGLGPTGTGAVATLAAPASLALNLPRVDIEREPYLEIRDRRDRRLVTVIELLSPTNKTPGPDRDDYLRKRTQVLHSASHFVEIDLLRGGQRPAPPQLPPTDYDILVSRASDRSQVGYWPIRLRDRLPVVPVPLAGADPDVLVDLQDLLHRTYDEAGYAKYIYEQAPQPPLASADDVWARGMLAGRS